MTGLNNSGFLDDWSQSVALLRQVRSVFEDAALRDQSNPIVHVAAISYKPAVENLRIPRVTVTVFCDKNGDLSRDDHVRIVPLVRQAFNGFYAHPNISITRDPKVFKRHGDRHIEAFTPDAYDSFVA